MVFSGRSLPQVPFFTLGPNPGTEWNRTNPTSLLKHKEKLERRALPQWTRRELDRCLKLPLASSTLLALEFDSFESMNELFSQDKRNTDYNTDGSPALKNLPLPQLVAPFPVNLQLSVTPPICFQPCPLPLPRATQGRHSARWFPPPKLLLSCGVKRQTYQSPFEFIWMSEWFRIAKKILR